MLKKTNVLHALMNNETSQRKAVYTESSAYDATGHIAGKYTGLIADSSTEFVVNVQHCKLKILYVKYL